MNVAATLKNHLLSCFSSENDLLSCTRKRCRKAECVMRKCKKNIGRCLHLFAVVLFCSTLPLPISLHRAVPATQIEERLHQRERLWRWFNRWWGRRMSEPKKTTEKPWIISNFFPFYRSTLEIRRIDLKSKENWMVWDNIETFSIIVPFTHNPFFGIKKLRNFKLINYCETSKQ